MIRVVFDVESMGLHGVGWSVGAVVLDGTREVATFYAECPVDNLPCEEASLAWLRSECFPHRSGVTHPTPHAVRAAFWAFWMDWKDAGATLWADCGWPVEARFLIACVEDDIAARVWHGPYPLREVAEHIGTDTHDRLPNELPAHNPLNDARQSARLLIERVGEP